MSSLQAQATVQLASDTMYEKYIAVVSLALFTYDIFLTLEHEVEYLWLRKFKLGMALYIISRYPTLLLLVLEVLSQFSNTSQQTCDDMVRFGDAIHLIPIIGIRGLLLGRAYAVTEHRRLVLVVLLVLGCCSIAAQLTEAVLDVCGVSSLRFHTITMLGVIIGISNILLDLMVAAVVIAGTLGTVRIYCRSSWNKLPLISLLGRQIIRFVLTINFESTALPLMSRPTIRGVLGPMQNSLSAIAICRGHLDLQQRCSDTRTNPSQDVPTNTLQSLPTNTSQGVHSNMSQSLPFNTLPTNTLHRLPTNTSPDLRTMIPFEASMRPPMTVVEELGDSVSDAWGSSEMLWEPVVLPEEVFIALVEFPSHPPGAGAIVEV